MGAMPMASDLPMVHSFHNGFIGFIYMGENMHVVECGVCGSERLRVGKCVREEVR